VRKEFNGEWYRGLIVAFDGSELYTVRYEDGDTEDLDMGEMLQVLLHGSKATTGKWMTVSHLYGEIVDVKVTKTKVGKSKKTTTKALLYVRWDKRIYDDDNDESLEWIEVQPKLHGADSKGGWELVPVRAAEVEAATAMVEVEEADGDTEEDSGDDNGSDEEGSDEEEEDEEESDNDGSSGEDSD
jgi:hypothetical protein